MTTRTAAYIGTVALLSQMFLLQSCGSNNPSTTAGAGGTAGTTPTGGTIGTGGATVAPTTGGTIGTGGATVAPATGGTIDAGETTGTSDGGTIDAGETTGTSDGGTSAFQPVCKGLVTAGGAEPAKGVVCTATDPQLCYKTCGPKSIGFKSETCTGGSYAEQSGCSFPPGDYSCYKIPSAIDPSCPTATPQASQPCNVATCVLCSVGGSYLDSAGASKTGYCVCPVTSTGSPGSWTCASTSAWPCPGGQGC
jgi:hypothetical protein